MTVTLPGAVPIPVEVKKSTTSTAQLRPLDYYTTAVWREGEGWWVIPPDDLVRMAAGYAGQHCISSFECFNPGPPNVHWERWRASDQDVPTRLTLAFEQGQCSPLKAMTETFRREILDLYLLHKDTVEAVGHAPQTLVDSARAGPDSCQAVAGSAVREPPVSQGENQVNNEEGNRHG